MTFSVELGVQQSFTELFPEVERILLAPLNPSVIFIAQPYS